MVIAYWVFKIIHGPLNISDIGVERIYNTTKRREKKKKKKQQLP